MRTRPLGATGLQVSELGFGCASYWGKPTFDERTAIDLVHRAIELGVTFFDTGASYARGAAEPRLGRALRGRSADTLVIATKAGTFHAGGGRIGRDFSPAGVTASAEASLRRLGLEVLPLLQLHGPAIGELNDDLLAALERLRERGLVRFFGVNSFDPEVATHAVGLPTFDAIMVDYNVLRPEREPLIAAAARRGMGVLAGMPLAMGHAGGQVLRLRARQDLWYAARGLLRHRREMIAGARFDFLRRLDGITGAQAALAYVLRNQLVSCAVVGTTRQAHLEENLAASGIQLPPEVLAQVRSAQRL